MKLYDAAVGFSVNPEVGLIIEDVPGPKKPVKDPFCLSGSSGNVATAIKKLGGNPHLLGLVSVHGKGHADRTLDEAVTQSEIRFTPIRALNQTNICYIPIRGGVNGEAWGKHSQMVHSAVPEALQELAKSEIGIGPETFTAITSLRPTQGVFASTLLERTQPGFRVLNAKNPNTPYARREFKKFLLLVDLLVINEMEWRGIGMNLPELHSSGPRLIVVTQDKEGGLFSIGSEVMGRFRPVHFPGGQFETGAGDWFLGAVISELIRLKESALTVKPEQFQKVVDFAAKVAGKKITMPGGGNGPTRSQLRH